MFLFHRSSHRQRFSFSSLGHEGFSLCARRIPSLPRFAGGAPFFTEAVFSSWLKLVVLTSFLRKCRSPFSSVGAETATPHKEMGGEESPVVLSRDGCSPQLDYRPLFSSLLSSFSCQSTASKFFFFQQRVIHWLHFLSHRKKGAPFSTRGLVFLLPSRYVRTDDLMNRGTAPSRLTCIRLPSPEVSSPRTPHFFFLIPRQGDVE